MVTPQLPTIQDDRPRMALSSTLDPLGQGGMGEVRRVLDPTLNRSMR